MILKLFSEYINEEKGFTLIEVLSVMFISGIIVLAISIFMISSFNTYSNGEDLVQIQRDIRLAVNILTKEIRNAKDIKLYNSLPESLEDYNYIYLDNNSFKMKNSSKSRTIYSDNITSLSFELENIEDGNYSFLLIFSISGTEGNSSYQISQEGILLNNLKTNTSESNIGSVIAYKKP